MARQAAHAEGTPPPAGPYSPSVRIGAIVAGSGQVGITADGTVVEGVGAQTTQALTNLLSHLAASGAHERDVISVRVFLTEVSQFAEMNQAYEQVFTSPYPARSTIYVGLPPGLLVEIDALAVVDGR
ncbi:MAG: Rid family hydrolase [Actinomycetes bacterium]